jgi:hypothetical protein
MLRTTRRLLQHLDRYPRAANLVVAGLFILLGTFVFRYTIKTPPTGVNGRSGEITYVDAFYFTMVTISTVGYGDLSPIDSGDGTRLFVILYIIVGVGFVFHSLSVVMAQVLVWVRLTVLYRIDKFDMTPEGQDTTGDGTADASIVGRSRGISGKAFDVDGDGVADFVAPPHAIIYWTQELIPALCLFLAIQLSSAAVFQALLDDITYGDALYHCMITATTVGYGDVGLVTQEARLFGAFHVLTSVSWLGALISEVDHLRSKRIGELSRAAMVTKEMEPEEITALDHDGNGVSELEFVVGMLIHLGVEICGEPMTWNDVRPFRLKFNQMDMTQTGKISKLDIELYAKELSEGLRGAHTVSKAALSLQREASRILNKNPHANKVAPADSTTANIQDIHDKVEPMKCWQ